MRYMFIIKASQATEPTPELLEAMHRMAQREIQAGRMLDDGGLMPLAMGCQVSVEQGALKVTDCPFIEAKEMIGGYAIFDLPAPPRRWRPPGSSCSCTSTTCRVGRERWRFAPSLGR